MTMTPDAADLHELEECIHLFECQLARATALAALCSAKGRQEAAARARQTLSQGGQDLAALRAHRRRLGEQRARCEADVRAG